MSFADDDTSDQKKREQGSGNEKAYPRAHLLNCDIHSSELIARGGRFIREHYHDPRLSIKALALAVGISERHLSRKFRQTTGMSPSAFINDYRLQRARGLVRQGFKIHQVARLVGFGSPNYLARKYKIKYGISPSQDALCESTNTSMPDISTVDTV